VKPKAEPKPALPIPKAEEPHLKRVLASEEGAINLEALANEPTGRSKAARELVRRRRASIDKETLESAKFINEVKFGGPRETGVKGALAERGQRRKFTKAEREAITLLRQGVKDPSVLKKIGKENLIPLIKSPSKEMLRTVAKVGDYFDKGFQFIKKETQGAEGLNYLDNYVTQIWDIPKNKRVEATSGFRTSNPFVKQRKIPSIEEGIRLGYTPKTLDITEILRIYDQHRITTAYNTRLVDALSKLKFKDEATGVLEPLVKRADRAPEDWKIIDHPALNRSKAVGQLEGGGLILTKTPLKVHPEIVNELKVIFDKPFSNKAIKALEIVNAVAKKGELSFSLFHHLALLESAASSGIFLKGISLYNPIKAYRAIKHGNFEIFKKMEVAKDGLDHGLTFGELADAQRGIIQDGLKSVERAAKDTPVLKQASKGVRKANEVWDAVLWDYIHNTYKLWAYESQVAIELKRLGKKGKEPTPEQITKVKHTIASFVNDSFGGQNWDLSATFGQPKTRQLMQLSILSPDWTVSTLKQAAAPFRGVVKGDPVLVRRGGLFWMRAALYINIIAQSANYFASKKHLGEGRFTWENDPGHELNIFAGFNDDGTKKYYRMGKQFREVLEWGLDPLKKFGAKMSPSAREAIRQLSRHDPGSGFPAPFAKDDLWSPESLKKRGISLISLPIPFSLRSYVSDRPANFLLALPASRGMSNFKTRQLFQKALERGNIKDVERTYIAALENNLDAEALFKSAKAAVKADITYDNKKVARKIHTEFRNLKTDKERADLLEHYRKRKILNPLVAKEFDKLREKEKGIKKQKARLKILKGGK
jgi:hypothetical protein